MILSLLCYYITIDCRKYYFRNSSTCALVYRLLRYIRAIRKFTVNAFGMVTKIRVYMQVANKKTCFAGRLRYLTDHYFVSKSLATIKNPRGKKRFSFCFYNILPITNESRDPFLWLALFPAFPGQHHVLFTDFDLAENMPSSCGV